jgi:hypothetical protein
LKGSSRQLAKGPFMTSVMTRGRDACYRWLAGHPVPRPE